MRYLDVENIRRLNIDVNSVCNAACPGCARQQSVIYKSNNYDKNKHLEMSTWKRLLDNPMKGLEAFTFCGNYGDAAATHYLPELIEYAQTIYPNAEFFVVSNMGLGSEEFWRKLSMMDNVYFTVSIDGMSETNHLYRRFVRWDLVEKNLRIIAQGKAKITWKYIIFEWNKHELESARALAEELNLDRFIPMPNNQPWLEKDWMQHNTKDYWNDPTSMKDAQRHADLTVEEYKEKHGAKYDYIDCLARTDRNIHIDWQGNIYPCCWYGGAAFSPDHNYINEFYSQFPTGNWNNINQHSLNEILDHDFFSQKLCNSWKDNPSVTCTQICGKVNDKWNNVNSFRQEKEVRVQS